MSYALQGSEWRGLSAMQLNKLGWLTRVLSISSNGDYQIASVSDNNDELNRAAVLKMDPPIWIEWRQASNQDSDIAGASFRFDDERFQTLTRYRASLMGTLLFKVPTAKTGATQLIATIGPGQKVTIGTIEVEYIDNGAFKVSGFP